MTATTQPKADERNKAALKVEVVGLGGKGGGSIQPFGLGEKPAEEQKAQNHNYRDYNNLY